jgi:hypothetical protein
MRFLMKIVLPTQMPNAVVGDHQLEQTLGRLFDEIGVQARYSNVVDGRRVEYALVDIPEERITATAEPVFRLLGVKPEFLPEVTPKPYYGRVGY